MLHFLDAETCVINHAAKSCINTDVMGKEMVVGSVLVYHFAAESFVTLVVRLEQHLREVAQMTRYIKVW